MPEERHQHGGRPALVTTVLGDLGGVLYLPAAMTVPTIVVALVAGEHVAIPPLVAAGGLSLLAGRLLRRSYGGHERRSTGVRTALAVVAAGWTTVGLLGAVVLWAIAMLQGPAATAAVYRDPLHALFEGISGATSTGLSVAGGLEADLPATIQWWRSLLQWVGSVGVIIFTLAVASTGAKGPLLLEAATRPEMLGDDVRVTARRIWGLFTGMSVVAVIALFATGVPAWEALNHGLTAIATGGFTITDDSFAAHGTAAQLVGAALLVAGAVSFVSHYQLLVRREPRAFSQGSQVRALALGLCLGIPVLGAVHLAEASRLEPVEIVFQWSTALATAGFSTVDLATWGPGALLLLVAAMVVGGSSGSTAGGIKLSRALWLGKALVTRLRAAEPGDRESVHRWDGYEVGAEHSRKAEAHAAGFVLLWVLTLFAGTVLVVVLEPTAATLHVLFDVSSALSNVGLDTGVAGRDLGAPATVVFILLMLLGRLEILGLIVLLRAPFVPTRSPDRETHAGTRESDVAGRESLDQRGRAAGEDQAEQAQREVGPEHPPPGA